MYKKTILINKVFLIRKNIIYITISFQKVKYEQLRSRFDYIQIEKMNKTACEITLIQKRQKVQGFQEGSRFDST